MRIDRGVERMRAPATITSVSLIMACFLLASCSHHRLIAWDPAKTDAATLQPETQTPPLGKETLLLRVQVANPDIVLNRARDILTSAQMGGAEILAVSCPLCESNLGQKQRELMGKENFEEMPIVYFTQLMAIALGLDSCVCQFDLNYVDPRPLLQSKGLLSLVAAAGEAS